MTDVNHEERDIGSRYFDMGWEAALQAVKVRLNSGVLEEFLKDVKTYE